MINFITEVGSSAIRIETGEDFSYIYMIDYGVDLTGSTDIRFSVQAARDAHIALSALYRDPKEDTYEILIGGWDNQKSAIRKCSRCRLENRYTRRIIIPSSHRDIP